MIDPDLLDHLVADVQSGAKYHSIDPGLIRRIGEAELRNRPSYKVALKSTRSRLHQVSAAYQESRIDYPHWMDEFSALPPALSDPNLQALCRRMMGLHASTHERLSILDTFFKTTLSSLPPIESVLDLACGLNPLALPWMPLAENASYSACDVYSDLAAFLNQFFAHLNLKGNAFTVDLTHSIPNQPVDLALLLKTLPCLEQLDKSIGPKLLSGIKARHLLVSFPSHSLSGRSKGMVSNYETHFLKMISDQPWTIRRFVFPSELAFLLTPIP
jgi:16S rRNA (guanine(1405)-N(7))-methyltransferase